MYGRMSSVYRLTESRFSSSSQAWGDAHSEQPAYDRIADGERPVEVRRHLDDDRVLPSGIDVAVDVCRIEGDGVPCRHWPPCRTLFPCRHPPLRRPIQTAWLQKAAANASPCGRRALLLSRQQACACRSRCSRRRRSRCPDGGILLGSPHAARCRYGGRVRGMYGIVFHTFQLS